MTTLSQISQRNKSLAGSPSIPLVTLLSKDGLNASPEKSVNNPGRLWNRLSLS